jgi:hypothetical protein
MAGMGPPPKSAGTRQRRNKTSSAAQLETTEKRRKSAPQLGAHPEGGEWDPRTQAWWKEVWDSPMADEFLRADTDGLFMLAALVDQFWKKPDAKLAGEIRLQRQCYGLTPIDRRRLQWEVSRVEGAGRKPTDPEPKKKGGAPAGDPRALLRAV